MINMTQIQKNQYKKKNQYKNNPLGINSYNQIKNQIRFMKFIMNTLLVILIFVFLISYSYALIPNAENIVADKYILISMVNQEPDPVEPGKYVTVKFKIENYGKKNTGIITVGIKDASPFSLLEGQDREKNIGVLESRQYGDKAQIVEWKLKVDKDAQEGENYLTLYYQDSSSTGLIKYEEKFAIKVRTSDSVIAVNEIKTIPEILKPGEEGILKIKMTNIADNFIKDVRVKLDFTGLDIATIGSTNEIIVQKINANEEKEMNFKIMVKPSADVNVLKIPIQISFKDNINNQYSQNASFGIIIGGPIKYIVALDTTKINSIGQTGEVNIRISNKGLSNMKFVLMTLKPSKEYEILSNPEIYVGKIDSDDYETVTYKIHVKETQNKDFITLRLLMIYYDVYNKEYFAEHEVKIPLYSLKEARKYGLVPKPNYTGLIIVVIIVAVAIWFFIYRRKKKKENK